MNKENCVTCLPETFVYQLVLMQLISRAIDIHDILHPLLSNDPPE